MQTLAMHKSPVGGTLSSFTGSPLKMCEQQNAPNV